MSFIPKSPKFYCEKCDFISNNKKDYNTHLLTRKHYNRINNMSSSLKFKCDICNITINTKKEYEVHLLTKKHYNRTHPTSEPPPKKIFTCKKCDKEYSARNSLWYHEIKCEVVKQIIIKEKEKEKGEEKKENHIISPIIPQTDNVCLSMMMDLIKQNQAILLENNEFKELIIEQNKKIIDIVKEGKTITNNTNNNTINNNKFNLNFFLNEQCKDAMNIMDFANSLKIKMMEVENVGSNGYTEGISDIIIRGLKELDIFKRPIHCSDLKREVLHVKNNDAWEKDQEQTQLVCAIKKVARNNFMQVAEWKKEHPNWTDMDSQEHNVYCKIVEESSSGNEPKFKKIIKNVAKEVVIEK